VTKQSHEKSEIATTTILKQVQDRRARDDSFAGWRSTKCYARHPQ